MTDRLMSRQEWLAELRQAWQDSGCDLSFEDWQHAEAEKKAAEWHRQDEQRRQDEVIARQLAHLNGITPPRYQAARIDPDHLDPDAAAWCEQVIRFCQPPDRGAIPRLRGRSLLVIGPTGRGKTHLSFSLLRHVVESGGRYAPTPSAVAAADLYARLRPRAGVDTEEVFERYARAELLLLDDLGAAKNSEWTEEVTFRLINHRYNNELVSIFTSNVPPKELAAAVGERTAGRIAEMSRVVVLKGNDRRRAA